MKNDYRYSVFIRFWLQSHLLIGIYSLICINSVNFKQETYIKSFQNYFSKIISYILIVRDIQIPFIITSFIITIILWKNVNKIKSSNLIFITRYGSLFDDLNHTKGLKFILHNIFLSIRRNIYTLSQLYLSSNEIFQRALNFSVCLMVFIYEICTRNYNSKAIKVNILISEFLISLIFLLLLSRSTLDTFDDNSIFNWTFICFIITLLFFQYLISFYLFCMKIKEIYNKFRSSKLKIKAPNTMIIGNNSNS